MRRRRAITKLVSRNQLPVRADFELVVGQNVEPQIETGARTCSRQLMAQVGSHGYPPRHPLSEEHLPPLATKLCDWV